jgi:hypothetical protein
MKTIEDAVSDIPKAKIFSVLDAKSVFLQIQLEERSLYRTTFNTPIGRYRQLRLPFCIKSEPEIYQKIMDNMISEIEDESTITNDILIAGETFDEHDAMLRQLWNGQRATI